MRGSFPKHNDNSNTNFASSEILDSLLPFEDQQGLKYSKDFMLSLYKPDSQLPSDFNQHEYVTTDKILCPLAFEELSESEKKVCC